MQMGRLDARPGRSPGASIPVAQESAPRLRKRAHWTTTQGRRGSEELLRPRDSFYTSRGLTRSTCDHIEVELDLSRDVMGRSCSLVKRFILRADNSSLAPCRLPNPSTLSEMNDHVHGSDGCTEWPSMKADAEFQIAAPQEIGHFRDYFLKIRRGTKHEDRGDRQSLSRVFVQAKLREN